MRALWQVVRDRKNIQGRRNGRIIEPYSQNSHEHRYVGNDAVNGVSKLCKN